MDAENDRSSRIVVVDDVDLPKRARSIERASCELGHQGDELGLAGGPGQANALEMTCGIVIGIVAPPVPALVILDPLHKAPEQKWIREAHDDPWHIHRTSEREDDGNDHAI